MWVQLSPWGAVPSPALCWLRPLLLSCVSCRPSCLQASVLGLWVPRLPQAQAGLLAFCLPLCLPPSPATQLPQRSPNSLLCPRLWAASREPQPALLPHSLAFPLLPSPCHPSNGQSTRKMPWVSGVMIETWLRREGLSSFPTCPTLPSSHHLRRQQRGEAGRPQGVSARALEAGPWFRMGGCPSLAFEGGSEGKWVGLGREKSQLFELPKRCPRWPQETASQMSLPGAREGGGGGFSTPVTFTLVI